MSHHSETNREQKKTSFVEQSAIISLILQQGMLEYAGNIGDLNKTSKSTDKIVRCIDEGTPGGMHIAGSGILMEQAQLSTALKVMGATGITSHAHCGAASLYAREQGLDPSKSDEYGQEFARKLAKQEGIHYVGHIEHLARPEEFHDALACYYDLTGSFDPSRIAKLPKGFVISRKFLSAQYAQKELKIAISIATGDHGYGEMITPQKPFLIIVVSKGMASYTGAVQEATAVAAKFGNKVKIETLLV